jgi:hypothetical protein
MNRLAWHSRNEFVTKTNDDTPRPKDDDENRPGAEGGESEATDTPPGVPADDSSPLGDTDQHSTADA